MAMQNKQTVVIAAGFSLGPCLSPLIREAFYSAKKLEKPGGAWNDNGATVRHNSSLHVRRLDNSWLFLRSKLFLSFN